MTTMLRRLLPLHLLPMSVVLVLVLAACGGSAEPTPTDTPLSPPPTAATMPTPEPPTADTPIPTPTQAETTASETLSPAADTSAEEPLDSPLATPTLTATPEPQPFDPAAVQPDLEMIAEGLSLPVFATNAGDGSDRVFVLEKPGTIVVIGDDGLQPQPFLDIRDRVGSSSNEQGLLGLAFHPEFANNGRFFVYYTDTNGDTVISRFQATADGAVGDPDSEVVLLTAAQPAANHNGGMLAFGPDGMLYAGLGDGGAANDRFGNGQNLATLLGTLIRLDVDGGDPYGVPPDNPFVDDPNARPEIWAYGLRNPWRFSFDRTTGDLYIADVGQNQWEEVNYQPADSPGGENYGWPIMESNHCFQSDTCQQEGLVLPVAEYDHGQGCSVTGGYVYRDTMQPGLSEAYFYGDYCSGRIWALYEDAAGQWQSAELLDSDLQISSFGETEGGEVLVVDYGGTLYRLVDRG